MKNLEPLDAWLKFGHEDDEEPEYEANVFAREDSTGLWYEVEWYHVSVGQVTTGPFSSYEAAAAWLEEQDFINFTS